MALRSLVQRTMKAGGSGGGGGGKQERLQYVRHVPKFLREYSHLLKTDKKNYMNEEVGFDPTTRGGFQNEQEVLEDGAVVVSATGTARMREQESEEDEVEIEPLVEEELMEVPRMSDLLPDRRDEEAKAKAKAEEEKEYFKDGKIIFQGKGGTKRGIEAAEGGEAKKPKTKSKKKLLSFDDEEA
jgi:hypothetical protein